MPGARFTCGACGFNWSVFQVSKAKIREEQWFCPKCGHCQDAHEH